MKQLVKFSRENCPGCTLMDVYLNNYDIDVPVEERHIDSIGELGLNVQGVPVLVVLDEEGNVEDFSVGFKAAEVDELVAKIVK